jgi:hypothetical protein
MDCRLFASLRRLDRAAWETANASTYRGNLCDMGSVREERSQR